MEIMRNGSQPSSRGPDEYFSGSVRIDPLFQTPDPAQVSIARVRLEPGAYTACHNQPDQPKVMYPSRSTKEMNK
jgi:quercetin dioxygenase-like cupin family protein